ncbi:MAG: MFS transporter [Chloroflexi bacterium]|nr:MFS transporter [Chloroflexota bacterium]MBU1751555.1 MFS transporter [Chloroflexota bacterium]
MKRSLILLFVYVFVDVLGFSLILPLLPYYANTFGASDTVVGLLLGANALTQLIGAPVIGRLSDRYGRRPLLLVSLAGTVVSFLLLGWAGSLAMLFFSRVLDGFLGGDISLAQAYISDVTDEKNRARGLGIIGAAFGLGFIFGPAIGGTLSAGGNYGLPAFVAAGLAALNLLGVFLWLPESLPPAKRAAIVQSPKSAFTPRALWEALNRRCVGPLLQVRLIYGLAFTMFETIFSLFALRQLGLDAQATSYVLTYVGVIIVLIQGGGIGLLTRRFNDKQLIFGGSVLAAFSLLAWALTPNVWVLLIVLVPLALASGVLNVVINSSLTKSVYPEEVGGILGLSAALGSVARVISPVVGGFLLGQVSPAAPGILGAVLMAWLIVFIWWRVLHVPDLECPEPRAV